MKKAAVPSILVAVVLLAVAVIAEAQQPKKVTADRVSIGDDPARESTRAEAIRLGLRERGYVERQNIAIEYRYAEGKIDRYPELAAELVRLKVDIIVVSGGSIWVWPAKNATKTIPIVMVGAGADPVETGLVESLARPGGNVTGITLLARELGGKRLELLKETSSKIARVAVLYDPAIPGLVREVKEVLPSAARGLRLTIEPLEIRVGDGLDKVFTALNEQRPNGLYVPGGRAVTTVIKQITGFALKSRLPSIYQSRESVEADGLMSYGADEADSYRRVAYYVDRILKGAKPADLPVEQPTKFELVISLKNGEADRPDDPAIVTLPGGQGGQVKTRKAHGANSKGREIREQLMSKNVMRIALCTLLLALCFSAEAQHPGKVRRIGFLDASAASGMAVLIDAFRQEMSKLGWIEDGISPSSTGLPSKSLSGYLSLQRNWFVLRLI